MIEEKPICYEMFLFLFFLWSSINDVRVLGGGGQGLCDDSIKALVIIGVTMG